jgi:hypothetical protein
MSSDSGGEGDDTVERIDMLSKRRTLLQHGLPLPGLRFLSVLQFSTTNSTSSGAGIKIR